MKPSQKNNENSNQFLRRPQEGDGEFRTQWKYGPYRPLIAAWVLHATLKFGLYKYNNRSKLSEILDESSEFSKCTNFKPPLDNAITIFYLKKIEPIPEELNARNIKKMLQEKLEEWNRHPFPENSPIAKNIGWLKKSFNLNGAECSLLFFAVIMEKYQVFCETLDEWNPNFSRRNFARFAGSLTGYGEREVHAALDPEGKLATIGLLTVENFNCDLYSKFKLMPGLSSILDLPIRSESHLYSNFMKKITDHELSLEDFAHLDQDVKTIMHLIQSSAKARVRGVNILFYGSSGTGKTELTKAIAQAINLNLFEVNYKGVDNDILEGDDRLKAFNVCQNLLAGSSNSLLMFDEIEDVFSTGTPLLRLMGIDVSDDKGKAWVNRVMENNPIPSIWITNNADIDPAYLRRFDYSLRFSPPSQKVRLGMARRHLGKISRDEEWLKEIASIDEVSPAQYQSAAKVAMLSGSSREEKKRIAMQTLKQSMQLLGQTGRRQKNAAATRYDASFVNADHDIPQLISGLSRIKLGSICFYGPPGTGKSELARHIADTLGKPLLLKRASDLMSKWVGETEQNFAAMFDEAQAQEAVLLLDEADSFLQDRRGAGAQWEVTQVNELLTQMEAYEGLFICTTNLMENLDQACLRRFNFKIKLDYLRPEQTERMFLQEFVRLGGKERDAIPASIAAGKLERLTPGDFATVVRQLRFHEQPAQAEQMLQGLARESRLKSGSSAMGFVR
ncbi:AAA family ATPase [Azonexus sp.]|uniref:AAA family ATPase n=1 Tax=Azonexus sp. TaxID=1872668 RepID=UPI0035ADD20F